MSDLNKLNATLLDQSTYTLVEVEHRIAEAYEAGRKKGLEEAAKYLDKESALADALRCYAERDTLTAIAEVIRGMK